MLPGKEREPIVPPDRGKIVEYLDVPEIPAEIEQVEAAGADLPALSQPMTDDTGQVIATAPALQQVVIVLPLTEAEMNKALHLKIGYSLRWLGEVIDKLAKVSVGRFVYRLSSPD